MNDKLSRRSFLKKARKLVGGLAATVLFSLPNTACSSDFDHTLTVGLAGSGSDYVSIQAAVWSIQGGNTDSYVIDIAQGTYDESVKVEGRNKITFGVRAGI